MLFTSLINSPSKCLLIVLFLIGTTYVFYLWSGKFKETNNPVFVINYASIDNPFSELRCNRLKYTQVGHVKTPNKVLFWPQIQYKYTLPQSVDFITPYSSVKNFNPQQVFGSFYTKYNATKISSYIESNNNLRHNIDKKNNTINYTTPIIWSPLGCSPSLSSAIIIPYRKRIQHLRVLTDHLHGFLRHQRIPYTIFIIEQIGERKFNRGALLNAGFLEVSKFKEYDCFILHDVDKLPEDDRIIYTCGPNPTHLSASLSTFNYKLIYERFFGGVVTFTRDQYLKINGFSNLYEGWGGEDDDLLLRVEQSGYNLSRINELIGRYYALSHNTDELNEKNPERFKLLKTSESRFKSDGLNSLKYTVTQSKSMYNGLIYWISIDIHPKNS
uniref:Beta-1,4-galactosyltransferase n=1 Tax=Schistosoma mansoni TaxID=6183 RepID=A0A3Q0KP76_SCHMA